MRLAARTAITSGVVTSERGVGHFDGGGVGAVHLRTAVDDDHVVAVAQRADDLAYGPVVDLLAAFAVGGREEQPEPGVVGEDRVLEDPGRDVLDAGEVDDGAPELDVEVGGDVAGLEVEVDQGHGPAGRLGGQGELDRGHGRADAALGSADGDDRAAGSGEHIAPRPRWRRTPVDQPAAAWTRCGQFLVREGEADRVRGLRSPWRPSTGRGSRRR